jgi:transposase
MGTSNYSDEFKRDAVQQITVRGFPVREVSRRLGVSSYSLYKWLKLFGEPVQSRPASTMRPRTDG